MKITVMRAAAIAAIILLSWSHPALAVETSAQYAYMIDAKTGAVLLNKNGGDAMHPSSMSKLMTLYVVFKKLKDGSLKMDDMLSVSEKAWRMQGSKSFVGIGDKVSVSDLIHGVIVQSGNDACIVLAEGIAGSEEAFVAMMNQAAKDIGLKESNFANATGWPDDRHLMSARDIVILARHIIEEFPEYYPLYSIKEYSFNNIIQHNRNRLLGNDIGVDGLKTGHTEQGGYGIAISANHDDRRLILVINGLASDDDRVREGDNLLRWGFREFTNKTLLKSGMEVAKIPVWLGDSDEMSLVADEDVVVTLPEAAQAAVKYRLRYESPLTAPLAKGAHAADLIIEIPGAASQIIPLTTASDISKAQGLARAWKIAKYYAGR